MDRKLHGIAGRLLGGRGMGSFAKQTTTSLVLDRGL